MIGPLKHLRVGMRMKSRYIGGFRGSQGRTLCGAPITSLDFVVTAVKNSSKEVIEELNICRDCLRLSKER